MTRFPLQAQLNVLGTKGVEVNGRLVLPPTTVELREGDTLEVRKKRFSITFPTAQELIQIVKAEVSRVSSLHRVKRHHLIHFCFF